MLWAWLPGDAATEASRTLFYASAFAIVLLAVRTQRDAATMVGLIAAATGLVTLYGCVRLAQGAPDSWMIYERVGWPTGYPNTSAALGVLGFWTLVGVGAERAPRLARALARARGGRAGDRLRRCSRRAAVPPLTLILVSPFAIALVRERLRLTAFLLVALAGLLPAIPALRTAIDTGTAVRRGHRGRAPAARRRHRRGHRRGDRNCRPAHLDLAAAPAARSAAALPWRSRSPPCCWPASHSRRTRPGASRNAFHSFTKVDASDDAGPHLLSVESNRWDFWKVAASDLGARPLTGYGAGSFGPTYLRRGHSSEMPAQAHGQLQELAATLGLPGLLLGAPSERSASRGCCAGASSRRQRSPVPLWAPPACSRTLRWTGTGRCRRLRCRSSRSSPAAPRCTPWASFIPRRAARISGGIVLAVALLWVLPGFAAERLIERAVANGDPAAAKTAATLSPFDPAPLRLAAQLEGSTRGLDDAISAADRGPQEWSSWAVVARLAGNDKALVARACARARSENPRLESCP